MELIYESDAMTAHFRAGTHPWTLVLFEGAGLVGGPGDKPRRQHVPPDNLPVVIIGARHRSWYPRHQTLLCLQAVQTALAGAPVVTFGESMGGYAAIKYAAALRAHHVVAIAPQYSIDPTVIMSRSDPFTINFRPELNSQMEIASLDARCPVDIVFDPRQANDYAHVDLIRRRINCRVTHAHFGGHALEGIVVGYASLLDVVSNFMNGEINAVVGRIRSNKRLSVGFHLTLYQAVRDQKPSYARWVLNKAASLQPLSSSDRVARSQVLFRLGRADAALHELQSAYSDATGRSSKWSLAGAIASLASAVGRQQDALQWRRAAVAEIAEDENGLVPLATALVREGKVTDADAILDDLIRRLDLPAAHYALSMSQAAQDRPELAAASCLRALQMMPANHSWRAYLASLLVTADRAAEAEALLAGAVRAYADAGAWYEWSVFLRGQGRLVEALHASRRAVQLTPSTVIIRNHLARLLLEMEEPIEALAVCRASIDTWLGGSSALIQLASVQKHMQQLGDATVSARRATEVEPSNSQAWAVLLNLLLHQGDLEAARDADRAMAGAPCTLNSAAAAARARLRMRLNDLPGAIEAGREAVALEAKNAGLRGMLVNDLVQGGQLEEAEREAREAVRVLPSVPWLRDMLIRILDRNGKTAEAIAMCRNCIALDPTRPEFRDQLSNLLFSSNQTSEALLAADAALAAGINTAELHGIRLRVLMQKGEMLAAADAGRRATELAPKNAYFHGVLGRLLLNLGNVAGAEASARAALALQPGVPWLERLLSDAESHVPSPPDTGSTRQKHPAAGAISATFPEMRLPAPRFYTDNEHHRLGLEVNMTGRDEATVRGFIGPLRSFQVHGWAFDAGKPNDHVTIEVCIDGQTIGTTTASLFYEHLAKAGIGKGDHGFVFNSDRIIPVEAPERIQVIARSQSGGTAQLAFSVPAPTPATPAETPEHGRAKSTLLFRFAAADGAQHPVFIFGSARSGTSAIAQALKQNTRYVGHGEGHLLDLLPTLLNTISAHYSGRYGEWASGIDTMIAAVPRSFMSDMVRHGFVELARSLFPGGYWLDKTPRPEMTRAALFLLEVWPDARFIYMKRRGFENIESRRRKFPDMDFREHCVGWANSILAWEAVCGKLGGRAIEVDQVFLSRHPEKASSALTRFLSLTDDEQRRLQQALTVDHPERTSSRFAPVYEFQELPWTPEQKAIFQETCGDAMRRMGFADTSDYFLADSAASGLRIL
jgi:tetratricopeptide (TPR) repeat protein